MSEFSRIFLDRTERRRSAWWMHCAQHTDDCVINPSGQVKSEVRQYYNIDNDEEILFVRDTSFWNNRNQGTVITDKFFYLIPDNDNPSDNIVFSWDAVKKVTFKDATIYFWHNDNINDACPIPVSWFLKDVVDPEIFGQNIAAILNECVKTAVDPVEKVWNEYCEKFDNEQDPHKKIRMTEEMISKVPNESVYAGVGYSFMADLYRKIKEPQKALEYNYIAIDYSEYGTEEFASRCHQISSIIQLDKIAKGIGSINDIDCARKYALMAARFGNDEKKLRNSDGLEITERDDARNDFFALDEEYSRHFLDLPYKDRKALLIVDTFDNLFQDHFVTLHINSDLSSLSFPTGHPNVNEMYVAHPLVTNRYMPIENYQLELIEDRVREFCELAQHLGAIEINIECLNSNTSDSANSGNRNVSGGASYGVSSAHGSYHNEYSRRLIEEISRSISLHQTFQPHKAPALPDNLIWYNGEPSWQRLYRQRMEGGLLSHEERIETKKSQVVDNREMNEIKGELESLFTNMEIAFDKTEESKFEQQENAVLAISVRFAPLSELTGSSAAQNSQNVCLSANERKYIEEVKECLADGEIGKTARKLLNMTREQLGISEARAAELEASVAAPKLTEDEKEYLETYREACADGKISDGERRMLDRYRSKLGISESRAKEIERMA